MRTSIWLGLSHAANYLFPIILVPYLARTLGVSSWGRLGFVQAFFTYVAILVEYGFCYSATRDLAATRDLDRRRELLHSVTIARFVLSAIATALAVASFFFISEFQRDPALFLCGLIWALGTGNSMLWYFQGIERLPLQAGIEVACRALATGATFAMVHTEGDAWKALAIAAAAACGCTVLTLVIAFVQVGLLRPSMRSVLNAIVAGRKMFLFRGAVAMYAGGNSFVLGLLSSPESVGYFAGAEKIARAVSGFFAPIAQALFPRIAGLLASDDHKAAQLFRRAFIFLFCAGVATSVALAASAPLLVRSILGIHYEPALPVLWIMSALPALLAVSNLLGIQWMVPHRLDSSFLRIIAGGGVLNLLLAVLFVPIVAEKGMGIAIIVTETAIALGMYMTLSRKHLAPHQLS